MAQFNACRQEVHARPEFAPLLPHLGDPATGQFSMAQMTNETRPTAREAALIASFSDATNGCFRASVAKVQSVRPDVAAILSNEHAANLQVVAQLVERRITWAESVRQFQHITSEAEAQGAAANQRYLAGENVEHQAELNRRAALQMQLMQNMQRTYETQQQTIYQPIQPQRQFHCTSMVMGTLVSTNCN